MKLCAILIGTLFGLPAYAADGLPLKHGVYASTGCEDAANAALLSYDGKTLNGAHSADCAMQVTHEQKGSYLIDQTCPARALSTQGHATKLEMKQRVSIVSSESFTLTMDDGSDARTFHYCSRL